MRRTALIVLAVSMSLMVLALFFGTEIKGSRRWIDLGPLNLQPSEFMKPAFVVICAWLFAENQRRAEIPGNLFAMILLLRGGGAAGRPARSRPDHPGRRRLGRTVLHGRHVLAVDRRSRRHRRRWRALAYVAFPHVASRINRFLTGEGDTFQTDTAREAIMRGGWLGQGPGEGTVKRMLPDSHTDFVFSVLAEEFGIVTCALLAAIFAFIVMRGLQVALVQRDVFNRLAIAGLVLCSACSRSSTWR